MDYLKYVGKILPLCKAIVYLVGEVKANKKRCRRLAGRVRSIEDLVVSISQRGLSQTSPTMSNAFENLWMTLIRAKELVEKCSKTKFLNLIKCRSEFNSVNEGLSDSFQVLCGALQVEQGTMMQRMFQDYNMDEDDDDFDDGFGLSGAVVPAHYSGAMYPVLHGAAAAPVPQAGTTFHAAMLEVEGNNVSYTEVRLYMQ